MKIIQFNLEFIISTDDFTRDQIEKLCRLNLEAKNKKRDFDKIAKVSTSESHVLAALEAVKDAQEEFARYFLSLHI